MSALQCGCHGAQRRMSWRTFSSYVDIKRCWSWEFEEGETQAVAGAPALARLITGSTPGYTSEVWRPRRGWSDETMLRTASLTIQWRGPVGISAIFVHLFSPSAQHLSIWGRDTIDLELCVVTRPEAWAEPGTGSYKASANMLSQTLWIKTLLLNISRFFSSSPAAASRWIFVQIKADQTKKVGKMDWRTINFRFFYRWHLSSINQ